MDFSDYAVNIAIVAFGLMFVFLILMSVLNVIDFFTGFISGKRFQSYHKRWDMDKSERASTNGNSDDSGKIPGPLDHSEELYGLGIDSITKPWNIHYDD